MRASTTFRQTEVLEREAGSAARKSTQSVFSTQAARAARLESARRCISTRPPIEAPHFSASMASSTQSMDGVLMVAPSKMSLAILPALVIRKSFGIGQAGV